MQPKIITHSGNPQDQDAETLCKAAEAALRGDIGTVCRIFDESGGQKPRKRKTATPKAVPRTAEVIILSDVRHLYERPFKTKHRGRAEVVSIIDYVEDKPCPFQVGDLVRGRHWDKDVPPVPVTSLSSTGLSIYKSWLIGISDSPPAFTPNQFVLVERTSARKGDAR